ncbi:hypothetical protein ABL78_3330 [Leptomonas seymouri]|uniref:BAG domain-containing protein n=1 Tax=Leptomonas seymouri TaxID=5684 RepID=A0A0N0P6G1_LEPSE|nr:hypothetical protein ABL78_3330 [Leptomonas seymouri]|eukprot:KPI87579.1 hypothetical protein ABL78_3330 [Leptomonas seymouri]
MAYCGYQPEQTKAQIRSTRGETIDLALPVSCLVGELRHFLIDEYNYDPNTRLLYNGLIADDKSYVCDYPFGSLMIATPADMQPRRQPLPPRQQPQQQQQPRLQEQARTSPHPSPPLNSGSWRKSKPAELSSTTTTSAGPPRTNQNGSSPDPSKKSKPPCTVAKQPPKRSPRKTTTTTAVPNASDGALQQARTDDSSPPATAARERTSPKNNNTTSSGRGQTNPMNSVCTPTAVQGTVHASSLPSTAAAPSQPFPPPPPPPPPQQQQQPSSAPAAAAAESPAPSAVPATSEARSNSAVADAPKGGEEELNHRLRMRFIVECHIPSIKKVVRVQMNGESSVVDLVLAVVAEVPEIGGEAHVIFRGKVLPQNPQAKLFDLGMRADTRVFIAAGDYSNPETITLLEIEEDTEEIDEAMKSNLTDLQRKGYYEELMRILFRTDGLQTLEGEWRQRRKDAVRHITELQDRLGVDAKDASA